MPKIEESTYEFYRSCGFETSQCLMCGAIMFVETCYERRGACSDCTRALVNDFALQHSGAPDRRVNPKGYAASNAKLLSTWKPLPEHVRWAVFKRDGYQCQSCGSGVALTVDHIQPRSKGGRDDPANLQTLCRRCNSRKGVSE